MMFEDIKIEVSGEELRDAATATLNRVEGKLLEVTKEQSMKLKVLSSKANKSHRYCLTLQECAFLGL